MASQSLQEPLLPLEQGNTYSTEVTAGYGQAIDSSDARQTASGGGGGAFQWVAPLLKQGSRQGQLHPEDLFDLPPELLPETTGRALWRFWKKEERAAFKEGRRPQLLRAVAAAYGRAYLALGVIKFVGDAFNFAGPLLLNGLLRHLDSGRAPGPKGGGGGGRSPIIHIFRWTADVRDPRFGYACAGLLAASLVLKAFLNAQYSYRQGLIASRLRSALALVVFRRTLRCNSAALASVGTGRVQTLMSVDVQRVADLCLALHDLWSLPVQIAIALALLYWQVQAAFLAGLAVVLALIPVNRALALRIQRASAAMMAAKDRRVGVVAELLRGVRAVKAACWEGVFAARMGAARREELSALATRKYLDALCVYFWAATSLLFSITTFGLFVLLGRTLTSEIVFTSLALFNVLLAPINAFPWVVNGVVEALVSVGRLGAFLEDPRRQELAIRAARRTFQTPLFSGSPMSDEAAATVVVNSGAFAWSRGGGSGSDGGPAPVPVLRDINLAIPAGTLAVVVGEVGAGKSSLLAALLGEMEPLGPENGTSSSPLRGLVAYVSQDPWVMHGTIRDNILMGRPMQEERYAQVLHACALLPDLAAWPAGDATVVGGGGANLSGGQRARLALGCALYRNADVYLLDDCLAAVDAHVAAWLVQHALLGPLLRGKTVLLVGHAPAAIASANLIVRMGGGRITSVEAGPRTEAGTAEGGEPAAAEGAAAADGEAAISGAAEELPSLEAPAGPPAAERTPGSSSQLAGEPQDASQEEGEEEEERQVGHVRWEVYRGYMRAAGWGWVATILLSMLLMQATRNGNDLWLSIWVSMSPPALLLRSALDPCFGNGWQPSRMPLAPPGQHGWLHCQSGASLNGSSGSLLPEGALRDGTWEKGRPRIAPDVKFYLTVLLAIAGSNSVFTLIRAFSFAKGGLVAAQCLHDQLVAAVLRLPASFFDATPPGRILNRFSSDTATVDDSLPFILNILLANAFSIGGVLAILCFAQPWALLALLPLAALYRHLQLYYRATSRELRRLDSVARSPVYTTFNEALAGGATIRACGAQRHFLRTAEGAVGEQARASLASLAASCWLSLRLQLLAATLAAAVAAAAVLQHAQLLPGATSMAAGMLGLSLSYVFPITGLLNGLLTASAETEQEMVSVERVMQYLELKAQPDVLLPLGAAHLALGPGGTLPSEDGDESKPLLLAAAAAAAADANAQPAQDPGADWPCAGHVVFRGVWLRYSPSGPYVLQGINLELAPGTRVGICGRTGAGKSSLVSCLLRLSEVSAGRIEVDGRDVATVPLRRLRDAVGLVPQTPFLFQGSVRDNLDPCRRHSDAALVAALADVQLWEALQALCTTSQGQSSAASGPAVAVTVDPAAAAAGAAGRVLALPLGEAGAGLSRGQQQLLALARVVLRRPRVVCLDEASASVDPATAAVMAAAGRFGDATVVEVAHRLASIQGCDVVVVMEGGRVVEAGPPGELAASADSAFAGMLLRQQATTSSGAD